MLTGFWRVSRPAFMNMLAVKRLESASRLWRKCRKAIRPRATTANVWNGKLEVFRRFDKSFRMLAMSRGGCDWCFRKFMKRLYSCHRAVLPLPCKACEWGLFSSHFVCNCSRQHVQFLCRMLEFTTGISLSSVSPLLALQGQVHAFIILQEGRRAQ